MQAEAVKQHTTNPNATMVRTGCCISWGDPEKKQEKEEPQKKNATIEMEYRRPPRAADLELTSLAQELLKHMTDFLPERELGNAALAHRSLSTAVRMRPTIAQSCKRRFGTLQGFESHMSSTRSGLNLSECLSLEEPVRTQQLEVLREWISHGLTHLDLSGNELDVEALASVLVGNAVLTDFDLSRNQIGVEGAKVLADALKSGMAVLTDLNLRDNDIGPEGAKALADALMSGTAVLNRLVLDQNSVGDEGAVALGEALKSNKTLKELDLYGCNIGAEGGKALAAALGTAVLTSLDVGYNDLDEEAALGIVRAARQHDKMTFLGLPDCKIGPTGAKEIAEYISVTAVLTSLTLSSNRLCGVYMDKWDFHVKGTYDASGIEALASAISATAVLTDLDLSYNRIEPDGIKALAVALQSGTSVLNKLVLSGNFIEYEGASALGEALKVNKSLKELKLDRCILGPDGGKALAAALSEGTAVLTVLDLRFNHIGDETAKALADALKSGRSVLKKIKLSHNHIMDEGAIALGEALKSNKTLNELDLYRCVIGAEGGKALASALGSSALTKLDARINALGDEEKKVLRDAAVGRKGFQLLV